ncbi:MAG: ribbon-helix-helix domain-containing protein [Acidimicrobiia bacterium]
MKKVTLRLPEDLADTISELAAVNGVSVNAMLTATCMQQADLFDSYGRTPVEEWGDHVAYDRWQLIVRDARAIDQQRRVRGTPTEPPPESSETFPG